MLLRQRYIKMMNELEEKVVSMARKTEIAIEKAIEAIENKDEEMMKSIIVSDKDIDGLESSIEKLCFNILLMEQPLATDFRKVSSALKMITDIERIADHASDISGIGLHLCENAQEISLVYIKKMSCEVKKMLSDSVNSYINKDADLARSLKERDKVVNGFFKQICGDIVTSIKNDSIDGDGAIYVMMIAKYLERIGDHAVNIGEWTVYAITGEHK